jgi:hypothetical protein
MAGAGTAALPRRAARARWVGWLGRFGLAAQGVCFTVIAVLALELAFGAGGKATDPQGAFRVLATHGWTRVLLVLLACGFVAYSLWRLAQALFDRGRQGSDAAGLGRRLIQLCQALIYVGLAVGAVRVLAGGGRGGSGGERHALGGVLGWPGGPELVGLVGAGFLVVAAVNAYWGLSGRFEESLDTSALKGERGRLVRLLGKVGFCALAVVLGVIGWFLLKAAVDYDASRIVSLGGALSRLAHADYGRWLLTLTAAGLLAYGLFGLLQMRYHRV